MKDVSKIVKKHLNEEYDSNWDNMYKIRIMKWIDSMVHNPDFQEAFTSAKPRNKVEVGAVLADAMLNVVEAGNLIMVSDVTPTYLVKALIRGLDASVNNALTEKVASLLSNPAALNAIADAFDERLMDEGCYFLPAESEEEAQEYAESGDYYYVCMLNDDGEWEEIA